MRKRLLSALLVLTSLLLLCAGCGTQQTSTAAEIFGVSYRENALLLDPVNAAIQTYRDAQ